MVPQPALSASISRQNAADSSRGGTICVNIETECSRWFQSRHYLRHYYSKTQQIVPWPALSASISAQNAADSSRGGTICVNIGSKCSTKCSRWYQRRHYLRHYRGKMQQMVPQPALSASISAQNAADSTTGTICINIGSECSR